MEPAITLPLAEVEALVRLVEARPPQGPSGQKALDLIKREIAQVRALLRENTNG